MPNIPDSMPNAGTLAAALLDLVDALMDDTAVSPSEPQSAAEMQPAAQAAGNSGHGLNEATSEPWEK